MKETLKAEKKFNTKFLLSNQSGVSMVTLIVTVIIIVILAGIAIFGGGEDSIDKATKVKFIQELSEVQSATDLLKKEKHKLKKNLYLLRYLFYSEHQLIILRYNFLKIKHYHQ